MLLTRVGHAVAGAIAVVAGLCLTCVVAFDADAALLNAKELSLYGGTYSANCGDPHTQRLLVLADRISVIRGTNELRAGSVETQYSYFGNNPPREFEVALMGQVKPNVGLLFLVYRDKRGRYLVLDGHPQVLRALGRRSNDPTRYYACASATRPSRQSSGSPEVAQPKLPFTGIRSYCGVGHDKGSTAVVSIRNDGFVQVETNIFPGQGKATVTFAGKLDAKWIVRRSRDIYLRIKSDKEIVMFGAQDYVTAKLCK